MKNKTKILLACLCITCLPLSHAQDVIVDFPVEPNTSNGTSFFGLLPIAFNNNQYSISMTALQNNIKTFSVTAYASNTGSICTGEIIISATFTSVNEITLLGGTSYTATNASSWSMVSNNGGPSIWRTASCIRYQYKDNQNNILHQKDCAIWYSGATSNVPCSETACGQSSVCVDSW